MWDEDTIRQCASCPKFLSKYFRNILTEIYWSYIIFTLGG